MASSKATGRPDAGALQRVLGHARALPLAAIVVIVGLAWAYLLTGAGTGMSPFAMTSGQFPPPVPAVVVGNEWTPSYAILMLAMWWTMMVAMMLPSATPFVLLHARVSARAQASHGWQSHRHTAIFLTGYLLVWLGFSALATLVQWALERAGLMDGMLMWSTSTRLSAGLLIAAGVYQLMPSKAVCLEHCRSPVAYLSSHWRSGGAGALRMGLAHGSYCLGCCWLLMALLFVGGTMNLLWIAGLSIVVLIEKVVSHGPWVGRALGACLLAAGTALMIAA
jgi:predicted metal-binding membrane protein